MTDKTIEQTCEDERKVKALLQSAWKSYHIKMEMLLRGAYEIGFADAMELGIDPDDHDESYGGEEPTCKPRATTAR